MVSTLDLPPDYQFKTTSDSDVYLVTEDREVVMDGKLLIRAIL